MMKPVIGGAWASSRRDGTFCSFHPHPSFPRFEMLIGYPPFYSDTQKQTIRNVLNWRKTLEFPAESDLSDVAKDVVFRFCCDRKNRLGRDGVEEIKNHEFFKGWKGFRISS